MYKNIESSDTALLVFGNGDGGGGPLAKMLENVSVKADHELFDTQILQLRRIRAASNNSRELPIVHMGHSVDDFFNNVNRTTNGGKALPVW
jgi:alpha-mannosidase